MNLSIKALGAAPAGESIAGFYGTGRPSSSTAKRSPQCLQHRPSATSPLGSRTRPELRVSAESQVGQWGSMLRGRVDAGSSCIARIMIRSLDWYNRQYTRLATEGFGRRAPSVVLRRCRCLECRCPDGPWCIAFETIVDKEKCDLALAPCTFG